MKHAPHKAPGAEPLLPDGRIRLALYALISIAALIPLAIVDIPPLVDYPNHLARLHVIANIGNDPALAANYQVVWGAMPNLALEAVTRPFMGLLSAELLGRMFIALSFALLTGGTLWLHRLLHGGIGLWPAAAWLFLYNHLLIMGFLGYLFTLGAVLVLFAAWIAGQRWPLWLRLTLFPAAVVALFFGHLFALGIYGICIAAWELGKGLPLLPQDWRRAARQWAVGAWQFVPAGLLVLATMPAAGERSLFYGPFLAKVRALWSPVLTWYKPIDAALILFVLGLLIAGLATRRLALAPALRLPVAILALLAAAMPFWIEGAWGSIWYADLRLPLALALLLVAGLRPRAVSRKVALAVGCAAAVLFIARIAEITADWRGVNRDFAEFRVALGSIEPGASLLPVQKHNVPLADGGTRFDNAYWHMPVMTVIDRAAFVPTLFTDPTKQPVRAAPVRKEVDTEFGAPIELALLVDSARGGGTVAGGAGMKPFWRDWPRRYDYVLITHFGARGNPLPDLLMPAHEGSFFDIYQVRRPEQHGSAQ
ncbi:MAG: hypothetical protein OEN55_05105 [Alphaproteobacteria bacterium]|nr:hypothetical protein [Alphaproteobacteria bacterium]